MVVSKVDLLVVGGKTQHLWTPSRMHGRGVVKPRWGKRSKHRGSTGQSPAALCPTTVLQLWWEWSEYKRRNVRRNFTKLAWGMWCPAKEKDSFSVKPQSTPIPAVLQLNEGNQEFIMLFTGKSNAGRSKNTVKRWHVIIWATEGWDSC